MCPIVHEGKEYIDSYDLLSKLLPLKGKQTMKDMLKHRIKKLKKDNPELVPILSRKLISPTFGVLVPAFTFTETMRVLLYMKDKRVERLVHFFVKISQRKENDTDDSFLARIARVDLQEHDTILETLAGMSIEKKKECQEFIGNRKGKARCFLITFTGEIEVDEVKKRLLPDFAIIAFKKEKERMQNGVMFCRWDSGKENTYIANALDDMNHDSRLRDKPGMCVQSIDYFGVTEWDVFGQPKHEADPNAVLCRFMQLSHGMDLNVINGSDFLKPQFIADMADALKMSREFDNGVEKEKKPLYDVAMDNLEGVIALDHFRVYADSNNKAGWVYAGRCQTSGELIKIGYTISGNRQKSLSNASVAAEIDMIAWFRVDHAPLKEKYFHDLLKEYRANDKREWFAITKEKVVKIFKQEYLQMLEFSGWHNGCVGQINEDEAFFGEDPSWLKTYFDDANAWNLVAQRDKETKALRKENEVLRKENEAIRNGAKKTKPCTKKTKPYAKKPRPSAKKISILNKNRKVKKTLEYYFCQIKIKD